MLLCGHGSCAGVQSSSTHGVSMRDAYDFSSDPGRTGLAELPDDELLARCRDFPWGSEERAAACEVLVRRYESLVRASAWQYRASPEPAEDLMQVGYIGLLKAIN